ncbi:unnamed protein product [Brassica rapa subsp. trilocularis]
MANNQNGRHTIILLQNSPSRATRTFMDYDSIGQAIDVQSPNPFLQIGLGNFLHGFSYYSDIGWAFPQRRKLSNGPFNNPNPCRCSASKPKEKPEESKVHGVNINVADPGVIDGVSCKLLH